jgi:biotin carboxylase
MWANKVGYPVILKPAGGGGGIGMKVAETDSDIRSIFPSTQALVMRLFADSRYTCAQISRNQIKSDTN